MPGKAALSWFSLHTCVNIINHPELNSVQLYLIMGATAPVGMNGTQVWVFLSLQEEMKAGVTLPPSVWNQMFFRVTPCKIWSWQREFCFNHCSILSRFHVWWTWCWCLCYWVYRNNAYGFRADCVRRLFPNDLFLCYFLLQPFMSPRYPGGPRVPVRMPNEFNGVSSTRFVNVP